MSSAPHLRLILTGLGFWGSTWIRVVQESPDCELAALVDADGAALARAAAAAGMQSETCFTSMAEAVRTIESDAALIVVPLHAHAAVALEALGAGLHCLIEKPFASAITEAQRIVEEGKRMGRVVMVSQQYRHRAPVRTIRRLVAEGMAHPDSEAIARNDYFRRRPAELEDPEVFRQGKRGARRR